MSNFALANRVPHLIVQPADLRLNPPESYLFVQDGLIIACGSLYILCYIFCMIRAYSDRKLPGSRYGGIQYLSLTMAYEVFYAFATTSTNFERLSFLAWFELDVVFTMLVLKRVYSPKQRLDIMRNMSFGFLAGLLVLRTLISIYPDDRQQITGYWTGILLQLPIGWIYLYELWRDLDTKGHSLEIWLTRYLGCLTAYGVFFWRYLNVPQNWQYVRSFWSIGIIVITLIPETIYPFLYIWVYHSQKTKTA